ncbi:MAG: hypothetical protein ACYS30_21565 [Planctomycetota bacterium]|jgi:hypothetical protein
MKHKHIILISLFCSAIAGCSPCLKVIDDNYKQALAPGKRVAAVKFQTRQPGGTSLTSGMAATLAGVVGAVAYTELSPESERLAGQSSAETASQQDYFVRLHEACLHEIERVLSQKGSFSYIKEEALQVVSKPHDKESGYIEEVIAINSLDAALKIRIEYGWKAGWRKRLALFGDWTLYDTNAKPTVRVKTYVAIPSGIDVVVDMKNQEYEPVWIELARKSAEDFLSICSRGTPIHGPKEVSY